MINDTTHGVMRIMPEFYLFILLILLFGSTTGFVARRKGYSFIIWFCTSSWLGLVVILLFPNANNPGLSDEKQKALIRTGNITGLILCILTYLSIYIVWTFGMA